MLSVSHGGQLDLQGFRQPAQLALALHNFSQGNHPARIGLPIWERQVLLQSSSWTCQRIRRSPPRSRARHQMSLSRPCMQSRHRRRHQRRQRRRAPAQNTGADAKAQEKQMHAGQSENFFARSSHQGQLKLPLPPGVGKYELRILRSY